MATYSGSTYTTPGSGAFDPNAGNTQNTSVPPTGVNPWSAVTSPYAGSTYTTPGAPSTFNPSAGTQMGGTTTNFAPTAPTSGWGPNGTISNQFGTIGDGGSPTSYGGSTGGSPTGNNGVMSNQFGSVSNGTYNPNGYGSNPSTGTTGGTGGGGGMGASATAQGWGGTFLPNVGVTSFAPDGVGSITNPGNTTQWATDATAQRLQGLLGGQVTQNSIGGPGISWSSPQNQLSFGNGQNLNAGLLADNFNRYGDSPTGYGMYLADRDRTGNVQELYGDWARRQPGFREDPNLANGSYANPSQGMSDTGWQTTQQGNQYSSPFSQSFMSQPQNPQPPMAQQQQPQGGNRYQQQALPYTSGMISEMSPQQIAQQQIPYQQQQQQQQGQQGQQQNFMNQIMGLMTFLQQLGIFGGGGQQQSSRPPALPNNYGASSYFSKFA